MSSAWAMIRNYIRVSLRNLIAYKVFSFVNIIGLAIGLTCFMLIAAFVTDELSYDQYPVHSKQIFRVGLTIDKNGGVDNYPMVDMAVGEGMKSNFPEILASTRIFGSGPDFVRYKDVQFKEQHIAWADSNFLRMFSIPFIEGSPDKALIEPRSIVITTELAKKYFGTKPPMGELLTFASHGIFKVTGIIPKIPSRSHFHYDAFISMTTNEWVKTHNSWTNVGFFTYLLLNEHVDPRQLEAKFPPLVEKYVVPEYQEGLHLSLADAQKTTRTWKFYLTSLRDIHLHSHTAYEIEANGDIRYVYVFGALAFFILLLACINFTNLSTASSANRSREVGIRKVLGSVKSQLVSQFLMESILLSCGALVIALGLVFMLLPLFNALAGKELAFNFFWSAQSMIVLLVLVVFVGIAAGIYPAFFLSSFQTVRVLKGAAVSTSGKGDGLRRSLVIVQFAISTSLIIATLIVSQQLHYMQNIKLGYDTDQVIVIQNAYLLDRSKPQFKEKLAANHHVVGAAIGNAPVEGAVGGTEIYAKGDETVNLHSSTAWIDYDYINTLGMKIVEGRNFSHAFPGDSTAVIVNETLARDFGWTSDEAVGKVIGRSPEEEYRIVGVVADFHYASARQKIAPLMMMLGNSYGAIILKVNTHTFADFLATLTKEWNGYNLNAPADYYFLNDRFAALYKEERSTEQLFSTFAVVAILIAGLGLFGLSAFSAAQRTKEIGIRKVLGATVQQIVLMLSREFLVLVSIAFVIAIPAAWWGMHAWLEAFAYRISINPWVFLLAGGVIVSIALVTVSFQALRAGMTDPAKTLRME